MKNRTLLLTLLAAVVFSCAHAQEVSTAWSEKQMEDNRHDGFFKEFLGSNSNSVFATYTNIKPFKTSAPKRVKILAFDKTSMKKVAAVSLKGFKENESSDKKFIGLSYYKTIVFENLIYVFWTKDSKNKEELYVQSFDGKLKPLNPLKKIYELASAPKSKKKSELFVMGNIKSDQRILIGGELSGGKEENIKIEYKLLNKDFTFAASNQITLPITITGKSFGLSSHYEFGDDGNLHVTSYVTMSKDDKKGLAKGESARFPIVSVVDLTSGKIKSHSFKFDRKNIFYMGYKIDGGITKVYGFFCDLDKDPSGRATHGILYATINNQSFDVDNVNFSYFTKSQLDQLFAEDKADRNKGKTLFKSKKKAKSDEESIQDDYVIEQVQSLDKDNLVLFCSIMNNYSVTTCDGKGNCTTNYYCNKRNVTAFKLGKDGSIVWASNLRRSWTFSGWNKYDVNVVHEQDKFIVSYASAAFVPKGAKGSKAKVGGGWHWGNANNPKSDFFEYAVFDYKNGDFTKKQYRVNAANVKKADKKSIAALNITVIDNAFYVNSQVVRIKPWTIIVGCTVGIVCPPVIFIPFFNPNCRTGTNFVGNIRPVQ
jgi:hypothetical protein